MVSIAQQKDYAVDVGSADAIVKALYEVISGGAGVPRDWDRFRHLFMSGSRLEPTRKNEAGELIVASITPDEYIQMFTSRVSGGFFESEIHKSVESYGTLTHIFSTYETREKIGGPVTNRGINSIQVFFDGKRYYVLNVFWCAETMGFALPERYLK